MKKYYKLIYIFTLILMLTSCKNNSQSTPEPTSFYPRYSREEALIVFGNEALFPVNASYIDIEYPLEEDKRNRENILRCKYNDYENSIQFECSRIKEKISWALTDYNEENITSDFLAEQGVEFKLSYINNVKTFIFFDLESNILVVTFEFNDIYYEITYNNIDSSFNLDQLDEYDYLDYVQSMYNDYQLRI